MERAGKKTRDIQFFSKKNGGMVCLHSPAARDYAKYLEGQPWIESYEAGAPLSEELYCHVSPVGIRSLYFKTPWVPISCCTMQTEDAASENWLGRTLCKRRVP